jgi:hypothetical protein
MINNRKQNNSMSMKTRIIILLLCGFFQQSLMAQEIKDVFDPKVPLVWLGLDFTGATLIGDREKLGSTNDISALIGSWNALMDAEREKFNIYSMTGKHKVEYRIDIARAHNAKLDLSNITSDDLSDRVRMTKDDVAAIVKSYDFNGAKGIGLMFNIENFNKLNNEAVIWVTFIHLENKTVLFTERMTGQPGGFGLRNYWGGAVYAMIKKISKGNFDQWKRKYSK